MAFLGSEGAINAAASQVEQFADVARVYPNSLIPTGGGEALAIGAEGHTRDSVPVAPQRQQFLAALRVPHLRRLVITGGGEAFAIGAEGHTVNSARVAAQGQHLVSLALRRLGFLFLDLAWRCVRPGEYPVTKPTDNENCTDDPRD